MVYNCLFLSFAAKIQKKKHGKCFVWYATSLLILYGRLFVIVGCTYIVYYNNNLYKYIYKYIVCYKRIGPACPKKTLCTFFFRLKKPAADHQQSSMVQTRWRFSPVNSFVVLYLFKFYIVRILLLHRLINNIILFLYAYYYTNTIFFFFYNSRFFIIYDFRRTICYIHTNTFYLPSVCYYLYVPTCLPSTVALVHYLILYNIFITIYVFFFWWRCCSYNKLYHNKIYWSTSFYL